MSQERWNFALVSSVALAFSVTACRSAPDARRAADKDAYGIIAEKQRSALGRTEPFTVQTAGDTLRRNLLLGQELPHSDAAALSSRDVKPIEEWPDDRYFEKPPEQPTSPWAGDAPLELTLLDALQIGARNNREYQTQKELVFQAALSLDLERDRFNSTWAGVLSSGAESSPNGDLESVTGVVGSGTLGVAQRFQNGMLLTFNLGFDLVKLLTQGDDSSFGAFGDATIAIPLLRGSGKFVVTEPLKQADRNVVYALFAFERFKRTFAVQIASDYYGVLQFRQEADNQEENYRWLIGASRRARRMAAAQRMEQIEVDQTIQDELQARDAWIEALQAYERSLDLFRQALGLPVDADVTLDGSELERLAVLVPTPPPAEEQAQLPVDAPIDVKRPTRTGGGPMELDPREAVIRALENRLDLRVAIGRVFDSQRGVVVAADGLRADLTLLGQASVGERRTLAGAVLPHGDLVLDEGNYSILASLGLPLERTAERNVYRNSLIGFEQAVRAAQAVEDQVKFEVREDLRLLIEARERVQIQTQSLALAERRVESTSRFLQVGRAETRDLLEARTDMVESKNATSFERIRYRLAELALLRDLEQLQIDERGLWSEPAQGSP